MGAGRIEEAERVRRALDRRSVIPHVGGTLILLVISGVLGAGRDVQVRLGEVAAIYAVVVGVLTPPLLHALRRRSRPFVDAFAARQDLDESLRYRLLSTPVYNALTPVVAWAIAGLVFGVYLPLRGGFAVWEAAGFAVITVLSGLLAATVVHPLTEAALRPMVAEVLGAHPEELASGTGSGVRTRLILAWAAGAGIPFVVIAMQAANPRAELGPLRAMATSIAIVAVIAGLLITWTLSTSIGAPLSDLRMLLDDVRGGRRDVEVTVDSANEIGVLQAGFNKMVEGLRERERLRDLFGRHVGEDVARRALAEGLSFRGERRRASVLFVDVIGSTAMTAASEPEQIVEMLNDLFDAITTRCKEEGGFVNKFLGDEALCVFGAPVRHGDHAGAALRTARAVLADVADLRRRHTTIDVGIGVATGDVLAGNVGSDQRLEYTVIGDAVNEAARLTTLAKERASRLVASSRCVSAAPDDERRRWYSTDQVTLRGRDRPTEVFEPARLRP